MTAVDLATFRANRRYYIGGTDVAAICGLSPWASPLSVYLDKTLQTREQPETLAMRRGLALEDFIASEFCREHTGRFVTYRPKPIIRTDWGFPAGASIDRMVALKDHPRTPIALLEAKTAFRNGWKQFNEKAEDLPDQYFVQVQWYLAVSGLPRAYAAADVGDESLRILAIEPDDAVQTELVVRARQFWTGHVETGVPPIPDGSEHDGRALAQMWPETLADAPVELDDEEAAMAVRVFLRERDLADEHQRAADTAKQRLCELMAEHEAAIVARRYRLTWKQQTRTTLDSKALRKAHPQLAEEFSRTSTTRVFGQVKEVEA